MTGNKKLTSFGVIVKKRLIDLDMTQVELAKTVGTTKVYMNTILYGKRSGDKYRDAICKVLGIDATELNKTA